MARWETDPRRWIRWTGKGKASDFLGWGYIAYTESESSHNHGIDVRSISLNGRGLRIANVLAISTIFTLNNLVAFSIWAAVGDKITDKFRTDEGARWLNLMFGVLLGSRRCLGVLFISAYSLIRHSQLS
jgi:uncharacterized membrane protein